ncbi:MAG: glycosyltransferase family 4 protein [Candidatus Omnitrophota bacterium]
MQIKFYMLEKEYLGVFGENKAKTFTIDEGTAVAAYKRWFFDCLSRLGKIVLVNEKIGEKKLRMLLGRQDAIFVSVNLLLGKKIPHRFLFLSLGSFLLPQDFYDFLKILPSAQVNLVSTKFQLGHLNSCVGSLAPKMAVFSNRVNTDYYTIPDRKERLIARKKQGIKNRQLHIVYAGRWIATKGICQLIRALDIWPTHNVVVTLAGNIEEKNRPVFSFASHKTFSNFLNEELLRDKKRPWLHFQQAKDKQGLRDLFWSADLFVNLSIQPDEDFGLTPRQAMSCGVPVVTTNFCGLRPLAESMPWKGVDTYPTLFGSRFSLRQFRILLEQAITERNLQPAGQNRNFVMRECNPQDLKSNLKKAIEYLMNKKPELPLDIENTRRKIKKQLFSITDSRLLKYFIELRRELPKGAYVYGDGPDCYQFPIMQGLYSVMSARPKVEKSSKWRGFFRIALWDNERAILEFGFPGPRVRRYPKKLWSSLTKCSHYSEPNEIVIIPSNKEQISIVQELVDLGYLVPDDY